MARYYNNGNVYVLSDDSKINIGDWFVLDDELLQALYSNDDYYICFRRGNSLFSQHKMFCKKVIDTNDPSLNLKQ